MNILFLYKNQINSKFGGVQRVTEILSDFFENERGHKVYYLSLIENRMEKSKRQYLLPSKDNVELNTNYYLSFLKYNNIDIVINQSGINPNFSNFVIQAKSLDIVVISVIHNSLLSGMKNFSNYYGTYFKKKKLGFIISIFDNRIIKKILLFCYKFKYKKHFNNLIENSDKIVLLSEKYKEEFLFFLKNKNKKLDKIIAISNPLSFSPTKITYSNKKKEILFVGRIDTMHKRVDLLLEVWNIIFRKHNDWSLKIVGDGIEKNDLIKMSNDMGLERISFEGFQDPIKYYYDASIFCMTSSSEGFGMVLLEAMNFGVVPIAFNSYLSVTDIIDDEIDGLLVTAFNIEEYANKLSNLILNSELRQVMSKNSINKSKSFSVNLIGNLWINLFNEYV